MEVTIKSKVTGKSYTGENYAELVAQCEKDDEAYLTEKKAAEEKELETTVTKKSYAKKVQKADKDVEVAKEQLAEVKKSVSEKAKKDNEVLAEMYKKARTDYENALKTIADKRKEFVDESVKMLEPAEQALSDAQSARFEAVANFNKLYGPYQYQVSYTGDEAVKEFNKMRKQIDDNFRSIFNDNIFKPFLGIW